jgi:hypothetical protein
MEIRRKKGVATYIQFPMVDTSGTIVTACSALDSEVAWFDDASFSSGFLDCTNESTESSAFGCYYLLLTSDETNHDYLHVKVDADNANVIMQHILINTDLAVSSFSCAASVNDVSSGVWAWSTRGLTSLDDISCAVWANSTRTLTSLDLISSELLGYTLTEPASADPLSDTPTVGEALMLLYMAIHNVRITNTSWDIIHKGDGTPIFQSSISDAQTSFQRGELSTI